MTLNERVAHLDALSSHLARDAQPAALPRWVEPLAAFLIALCIRFLCC